MLIKQAYYAFIRNIILMFIGDHTSHVKAFTISTSCDGTTWATIEEAPGMYMLFQGNSASELSVARQLPSPLVTRFVRLTIFRHEQLPALRWAIEGCPI